MFEPYLQFINYKKLNRYIVSRPARFKILNKWLITHSRSPDQYIGENSHGIIIYVYLKTGSWTSSRGDGGKDFISLCSYIFNISQHKAALRIIETMRWSDE